jgi:hypothetical protein
MITQSHHGLLLETISIDGQPVLSCKAIGHLTHADYETFVSLVEQALADQPGQNNRLLFDTTELEGWDLRAALDDLNFGLKHRDAIGKAAVVSGSSLMDLSCRVANSLHLYGRELRSFHNREEALSWLLG